MGLKERRLDFFTSGVLPVVKGEQDIICPNGCNQFIFDTGNKEFGKITIYPKGNIFQIHKGNRWYREDAILYVINNCIENKEYVLKKYNEEFLHIFET